MLTEDEIGNAVQRLSDGLRQARLARGLTMDQLAELSGVNKSSLSRIENNLVAPSAENLLRLASALGVSLDGLVGRTGFGASAPPAIDQDAADPTAVSPGRARALRRLNFLTRPSLTVTAFTVTRDSNVPAVPTRKRMEEHLVCLSGAFAIQYQDGLVQAVAEGEVVGLINRQPFYRLKLRSERPAEVLRVSVPVLRDRLKRRDADEGEGRKPAADARTDGIA